ncbi:MAG TPA: HAMP domain-containing sensor histidine kinase [Dissulfurispiraceae bacterium]|nr:HAMP domain-containing sensor histidine kinase [Dissulfurispiraceae bacterium]
MAKVGSEGQWNSAQLSEALHWAMMMGLDVQILDMKGNQVVLSHDVIEGLSVSMKQHMEGFFHVHGDSGDAFHRYPLGTAHDQFGTLLVRPFPRKELAEKEAAFKSRTQYFLGISLAIAGGGALIIGLFLSQYLSKPVRRLQAASEKIAKGDFSARVLAESTGEVGDLAKAFNRMSESLQREEQLRKRLLENIAHELRTPLTIMKTRAEAMADGLVPDSAKGIESIISEVDRLTSLVKGIEDITAAEASFFKPRETADINLPEFLAGIIQEQIPAFHAQGLKLCLAEKEEIIVRTDAEKLERIVGNLLSNALKFTDLGTVSLDFGLEQRFFFVSVIDTGKGIPADELPYIFSRFYRVDHSGAEGLGLGLAIVKELVDVMHGRIEVKSAPGAGTTVKVLLPRLS